MTETDLNVVTLPGQGGVRVSQPKWGWCCEVCGNGLRADAGEDPNGVVPCCDCRRHGTWVRLNEDQGWRKPVEPGAMLSCGMTRQEAAEFMRRPSVQAMLLPKGEKAVTVEDSLGKA